MDNYTISGTNIMTTTSQINKTTLTLPYNARQALDVAATNCIGTSGPATFTYFEGSVYGCIHLAEYLLHAKSPVDHACPGHPILQPLLISHSSCMHTSSVIRHLHRFNVISC